MVDPRFNYEYLESDGGKIESAARYCASHSCPNVENQYFEKKEPCKSYREGRCMIVEFLKQEVI